MTTEENFGSLFNRLCQNTENEIVGFMPEKESLKT